MGLVAQAEKECFIQIIIWFQKGRYHLQDSSMAIAIEHESVYLVNLAQKKCPMAGSGEHRN
jgi:hypothetical protein